MAEAPKVDKKDDKKGEKKESKPVLTPSTVFFELIAISIGLYFLSRILSAFNTGGGFGRTGRFSSLHAFFDSLGVGGAYSSLASTFVFFTTVVSMLFIAGIIYTSLKLHTLEKMWKKTLYPDDTTFAVEKTKNSRWERVVAHISSDNPSDWRLAILECDIILEEMLDNEGFIGNTISDKLKTADSADFQTLNNAWEAHKIRNAIAHEGQDFTLTQREARRIVALYESVFREFDFI
jgi:hypothetical protein